MSSSTRPQTNRRLSRRQLPKGGTEVTCLKGSLGLGVSLALAVLDLSETGIRLVLKTPLEKKQEIEVSLTKPGSGRPFKVAADVMWSQPTAEGYRIGARFRRRLSYAELQELCR
jgi:hypothetical protein